MRLISTPSGKEVKVHQAGLRTSACYGADISGISPSKKRSLRAGAADAAKWGCSGANPDLTWATENPRKDPHVQCTIAPLKRYAREWWIATDAKLAVPEALSPAELNESYEIAHEEFTKNPKWSNVSQNPIMRAISAVKESPNTERFKIKLS